jgi:membrane associated rhomboid family serine protease
MRLPHSRAMMTVLIVTIAAWVIVLALGNGERLSFLAGFIPVRVSGVVVPGALPVWLTPLTATLLHSGAIHLGFNMLMLGYCGRFVEYALGAKGAVIVYVIGAYAAAALQYLADPASVIPMVGASGAISALVGAYALLFSQRKGKAVTHRYGHWLHVLWLAAGWIFVQLLVGLASAPSGVSIAIAAHIGGFVAGLLLARPLLLWRYRRA